MLLPLRSTTSSLLQAPIKMTKHAKKYCDNKEKLLFFYRFSLGDHCKIRQYLKGDVRRCVWPHCNSRLHKFSELKRRRHYGDDEVASRLERTITPSEIDSDCSKSCCCFGDVHWDPTETSERVKRSSAPPESFISFISLIKISFFTRPLVHHGDRKLKTTKT